MFCRTLDCVFDAIFDPSDGEWVAVYVYRDGNQHDLGRFPTEDEAEACALAERARMLQDNGQFGVGA